MATNETASGQDQNEIESTKFAHCQSVFDYRSNSRYLRRSGTPGSGNKLIHMIAETGLPTVLKLILSQSRSCARWRRDRRIEVQAVNPPRSDTMKRVLHSATKKGCTAGCQSW